MQCELCDKSYERRAWLARHMQDAHGARLDGSPADLDEPAEVWNPLAVNGRGEVAPQWEPAPEPWTDAAATYQPDADQTTRIRNLRRSGVSFPEAFESVMGVVPPPEVIATFTPPAVNRLDGMAERVRAGRVLSVTDGLYLYRLALIGRDAIAVLRKAEEEVEELDGALQQDLPSGEPPRPLPVLADINDIIDRWEAADQ